MPPHPHTPFHAACDKKHRHHTPTHKAKPPESKKQRVTQTVLLCRRNCHTHTKRKTAENSKRKRWIQRCTTSHNQQATSGKRRNQNRLFWQTSRKMKNKAAAFFFY
jgi:hypothetical protein